MKHIDEKTINSLINIKVYPREIDEILEKTKLLKRLSLEDCAKLLAVADAKLLKKIYKAAARVKNIIYGKRVVLFVPLYISNVCANTCLYCGFSVNNKLTVRKKLSLEEIKKQTEILLKRGHKRILMVAGETASSDENVNYYIDAVKAIYAADYKGSKIKRVNVNVAPLSVEQFKKLKDAGIGTYQLFQETYHDATYRKLHVAGAKSEPDNRLDAIDRAFEAGIDDVGIGTLFGLYDYRFEVLAMLMHIEYLEKKFGIGPHTISMPRIEPAQGTNYADHGEYPLTDENFKKLVAVLRLSVPYTGIIMSTRETSEMRDELVNLGVSQISAESRVTPGGYEEVVQDNKTVEKQFSLNDQRSLTEITSSLILQGLIPSFCAACYRKNRTGEHFMDLAKPGDIKHMCDINALVTLKEYLEDFAEPEVKKAGYKLIEEAKKNLDAEAIKTLEKMFKNIDAGIRDEYV
ncbi:[FeFe] hydrogenase H-cluster radical SAM maturase HydG [Endomicrobium proavitum]|uniref:Thiamine biosynthesis protein ThiH n=1 Tax=Endomicrobium proavitum TaxID=1408281 RepID=A0A0G3WHK0_9BACT|nr:[FeFe] hydrogenase H-cluster radical SAM maturase HydG [Endomicrobium proavitum]AKL98111.1 Thiamine biosynthesis protein ThiH [Endomicrobium proavitum]